MNRPVVHLKSLVVAVLGSALLLSGCGPASPRAQVTAPPSALFSSLPPDVTAVAPAVAGGSVSSGQLQFVQEPADGYRSVYAAIKSATKTLTMTMYQLADPTAQAELIAAAQRGVIIRIVLDRAFHGQQVNQPAYDQLSAAGVSVHWGPDQQVFHQKTITIDGSTAWIGTGNLTSKYYPTSRDAWIVDTNPSQVRAIAGTFDADWNSPAHSGDAVGAEGLVWSPGASQQIVAYINRATVAVDFTSQELADSNVIAALVAAGHRHVICRVVMSANPSWKAGFDAITDAGCNVHVLPNTSTGLYIHEKEITVDHTTVLIGSHNASPASLNKNRELSIEVIAPAIVSAVEATFNSDYTAAPAWRAKPR